MALQLKEEEEAAINALTFTPQIDRHSQAIIQSKRQRVTPKQLEREREELMARVQESMHSLEDDASALGRSVKGVSRPEKDSDAIVRRLYDSAAQSAHRLKELRIQRQAQIEQDEAAFAYRPTLNSAYVSTRTKAQVNGFDSYTRTIRNHKASTGLLTTRKSKSTADLLAHSDAPPSLSPRLMNGQTTHRDGVAFAREHIDLTKHEQADLASHRGLAHTLDSTAQTGRQHHLVASKQSYTYQHLYRQQLEQQRLRDEERARMRRGSGVVQDTVKHPLVYIDVALTLDHTERLTIFADDDLLAIADDFVAQHALKPELLPRLHSLMCEKVNDVKRIKQQRRVERARRSRELQDADSASQSAVNSARREAVTTRTRLQSIAARPSVPNAAQAIGRSDVTGRMNAAGAAADTSAASLRSTHRNLALHSNSSTNSSTGHLPYASSASQSRDMHHDDHVDSQSRPHPGPPLAIRHGIHHSIANDSTIGPPRDFETPIATFVNSNRNSTANHFQSNAPIKHSNYSDEHHEESNDDDQEYSNAHSDADETVTY